MHFFFIFILSTFFLKTPSSIGQVGVCSEAQLTAFVEKAQEADTSAINRGRVLIRCPFNSGISEIALQWLAFLYVMNGDKTQGTTIHLPGVPPSGISQDSVLMRARHGAFDELRSLIDKMEPGYATNAKAQLVFARLAMRKSHFSRAREAYQVYLRLRPNDRDVSCEEVYTHIWEGHYSEAFFQFQEALRFEADPRYRACLMRGLKLSKVRGKDHGLKPVAETALLSSDSEDPWRLRLALQDVPHVWRRQTASAGYSRTIGFEVAGHELRMSSLGREISRASEMRFFGRYQPINEISFRGELGYWSLGERNATGNADLNFTPVLNLNFGAGFKRVPLALLQPVVKNASGVMQDALVLHANYFPYLDIRMMLLREERLSPHEFHTVLFRWPVFMLSKKDYLNIRAPLTLERYPRPSPFYVADVRTDRFGLGIEWHRMLKSRFEIFALSDYVLASAYARDPAATLIRYAMFDAELRLVGKINSWCSGEIQGELHRADDEWVERRRFLSRTISLGFSCRT